MNSSIIKKVKLKIKKNVDRRRKNNQQLQLQFMQN